VTEDDRYPLPSILDFSSNLDGCTVFSKVDLVKDYHQVPMAEADIPKTAICTPFGLFEYLFMPFGLKNAAQTFQRLMDRLFRHLPFVFVYLDDILIASRNITEHMVHLRQVLTILRENGLQINPAKCIFAAASLSFLGHNVDSTGISPLKRHVQALMDFPPPSDLKQLQRYLGMINFYRRFLPGIAGTLQPLTDLLRGNPKTLVWSEAAATAFTAGKAALASCTKLVHPTPGAIISLAVDASDSHVGGVLQQLSSGSWLPLAFFSRKLSTPELKYSTFDRELLAAFAAIRHFRFVLEGRSFRLLTDHMPLTLAMRRVSAPWSARQVRQLAYISEFTTDLRHVPGTKNVVADTLSRPSASPPPSPPLPTPPPPTQATVQKSTLKNKTPKSGSANFLDPDFKPPTPFQATVQKSTLKNNPQESGTVFFPNPDLHSSLVASLPVSTPIDYTQMAALQSSCAECTQMCNSTVLFVVTRKIGGTLLRGDISSNVFRPLVPVPMRTAVISAIHNVAHPGIEATVRLVTAKFCWPKMAKQIRLFAQQCVPCQMAKVSTHVHLTPAAIPVPQRRFEHLHVDLVGPLPPSSGYSYLFTVVDRTTRWPEAIPIPGISAADCAAALFSGWIQRFGVPAYITSDRGAQFTSSLWASLCELLSISHITTTAYHPQSNGLVERFHRRLKDSLRARLAGPDWISHLPWVLLGIRTSVPLEGGLSPAEAVMGCQPLLPGQFLPVGEPPLEGFLDALRANSLKTPRPVSHKNTPLPTSLPPDLMNSEFVFVRKDGVSPPLAQPYDGPYKVIRRSLHSFQLQIGNRAEEVSTHRLKVCHAPPDTAVALPPKRGRPPNRPPPLPVMVRNHLTKTPESSLRQKSSRNPGADPLAVQENFLAQQRKLQEKIQPSPASGRHRLKNRREDRGLLTRTSTLPYLPR
jgi:hypothetical protein